MLKNRLTLRVLLSNRFILFYFTNPNFSKKSKQYSLIHKSCSHTMPQSLRKYTPERPLSKCKQRFLDLKHW